jgi:hypothetical protein
MQPGMSHDQFINDKLDALLQAVTGLQQSIERHFSASTSSASNDIDVDDWNMPIDSEEDLTSMEELLQSKVMCSNLVCAV